MDRMDSGETFQIIHFHNYSKCAIQSIISEIKKFPIIYKRNKSVSFAQELIDLAWLRIVSTALDSDSTLDATERGYWELSFREVWKWMRSMLAKDMKARLGNPVHVRNPEHNWFLNHLKFMEKHIFLDEATIETVESDPNIHVKVISSDTVIHEATKHTIIWVRDFKEETVNEQEGISICFRTALKSSKELQVKPITSISLASQVSSNSNDVKADDSCKEESMPTCIPSSSSCSFKEDPKPECIPSSSSASFFSGPPQPSCIQSSLTSSTQDEVPAQTFKEEEPVPQPKTFQILIDEDFQFIMSLLPKLKKLEPRTNTEVKMLIMQALHDAF